MQFAEHNDVVFARGIVRIDAKRIRIRDQTNFAPSELAIRSRHVEGPVELLTDNVNENCVLGRWKFVDPFRPKWNREADQQNRLDQHDRKLEVRRDSTTNTGVIGLWVAALAKTNQ